MARVLYVKYYIYYTLSYPLLYKERSSTVYALLAKSEIRGRRGIMRRTRDANPSILCYASLFSQEHDARTWIVTNWASGMRDPLICRVCTRVYMCMQLGTEL